LVLEVTLHFGTLMAVFVYFGKDIMDILRDIISGKWKTQNARLGFLLILSSIPAGIVGYFVKDIFDSLLSGILLLGIGFGINAMLLFIASAHHGKGKTIDNFSSLRVLIIGIAQALAIMPSISRSGVTISSGVLLGLDEKSALRFSFLMSIPVILGASLLTLENTQLSLSFLPASLVSFAVGLATIHIAFVKALNKRKNFVWFGLYCLLLSIGIIIFALL